MISRYESRDSGEYPRVLRLLVSPGMTLLRPSNTWAVVELDVGLKNVY